MRSTRRIAAVVVVSMLSPLALAACGSDDDAPAAEPTSSTTTSAAPKEVAVTGVDYAFQGLPKTVSAGTTFTFRNGSTKEPHEMLLFHVPAGEKRSLEELLALPEEEAGKAVGDPVGVAVAPTPGGPGTVVEGELVAKEPGRYLVLCALPVGADPQAIRDAMESDGPPPDDPNAGPPHFTKGMVQEVTVK